MNKCLLLVFILTFCPIYGEDPKSEPEITPDEENTWFWDKANYIDTISDIDMQKEPIDPRKRRKKWC